VFVLDFSLDTPIVSQPFKDILEQPDLRPETVTEGRARVLPDGGLFIEETNWGRHFRISKDRIDWIRFNDYSDRWLGMLAWSRYLTKTEGEEFLKQIRLREL
jgi:hypothetical protein